MNRDIRMYEFGMKYVYDDVCEIYIYMCVYFYIYILELIVLIIFTFTRIKRIKKLIITAFLLK